MMRLLVLFLVVQLSGCMSFEISSNSKETEESVNGPETVHGSMWRKGKYGEDYNIQKCHEGSLARVEFTFLAHQLVLSAISLGIYVPQTVETWCEDVSQVDDTHEPGLKPEGEGKKLEGEGE